MKKAILAGIAVTAVVFLLSSCSSGVSQEQYNKATADLTAAQTQAQSLQTQLQSLQSDKTTLTQKNAAALAYAEFLDALMSPAWQNEGIAARFTYTSRDDYLADLNQRASSIGDSKLTDYLQQIQNGDQSAETKVYELMSYCISKIEDSLK